MKEQYFKIKNKLDISKKFPPNYFNKWLLNGVFIFLALFWFFLFVSNDFNFDFHYLGCEEGMCENPLYMVDSHPLFSKNPELKYKAVIFAGEHYGRKPGFILTYFDFISVLIIIAGFVLNHILFKRKEAQSQ